MLALESRQAKAIRLRRQGFSLSQIARILGLPSINGNVTRWVRGVPAPGWTRRPRAKDEVRARAIRLRLEGRSYREIHSELDVSKSTLSVWLRDVPLTAEHRAALAARQRDGVMLRATAIRAARQTRERRTIEEAAAEIGPLSDRDVFVAGVAAYWAEGTKNKPGQPSTRVTFINSDPAMIRLFLHWLSLLGVGTDALTFRVNIHERADVEGATRYWSEVVNEPVGLFQRPTLKRHNPRTNRKNVGNGYHGCLVVKVRRSTELNRRIQGWFQGIASNLPGLGHTEGSGVV